MNCLWGKIMELFDEFPYLEDESIIIRQMDIKDIPALKEMGENDNVYKYIPRFLYKKSDRFLETAIKNLNEREFIKQRQIIAGIYLKSNPQLLVGLAEMFEYKKRLKQMTVGYQLNESYWNQGIATAALKHMKAYLLEEMGLRKLQAFVMPENIYSQKVLRNNGFQKQEQMVEQKNWAGQDTVMVEVYTCLAQQK